MAIPVMFELLVGRRRYSRNGGSNRDNFNASVLSKLPSSSYRIAEEETCGVLFHLHFLFAVSGMCQMFFDGAHLGKGKDGGLDGGGAGDVIIISRTTKASSCA